MEGSIFSNRVILSIGLLLASTAYILYTGIIINHVKFGPGNSAEGMNLNIFTDKITTAMTISHVLTKEKRKISTSSCPDWSTSPLKMNLNGYFYGTEEFYKKSTCSDIATSRGPHQHVVSFSFYGNVKNRRGYFKGIEENAKLVKKYYPNWTMRLYHDIKPIDIKQDSNKIFSAYNESIPTNHSTSNEKLGANMENKNGSIHETLHEILCHLMHAHSNLDLCYVGNIPSLGNLLGSQGNMWRFLPMADPLVDVFISRDLDSRPSEREVAAVNDWLNSNLTFHIMRDHPFHTPKILAGMWGAVVYPKREELFNLTLTMMAKGRKAKSKGLDQIVLKEVLWPAAKESLKQHDSYHCKIFGKDRKVDAWPSRRNINEPYNFVGARIGVDVRPMQKACPLQCRPPKAKHWVYC
ncbi:uncharacterized protein LOC124166578 isoform X2 [Ischnura elegans]|uniref:uncharacterized protein LOC124166578 isoform X2 n=1 Tax=Ischnura elegans TaxID=197161 RepID=UPI001ED8A8E8|nr:uncharacterized protein LOC124166578 isoform X2 [Ischnura elegans]